MIKLDQKKVRESGWSKESIPAMQTAIYVMCGGGILGEMAAERPKEFYIDSRVGKLPYSKREIFQAVVTLISIAESNGMDASNLPPMPRFHNMGIF